VIGISLAISSFGQTKQSKLTPENKSAIIESILNQFFEDYPDEFNSGEIVLSSQNLDSSFTPKHSRVKLRLLSPDEIKAKVMRERFLDYLIFSKLEIKGSKVFATLENLSVRSVDSDVKPFFGHGFEWEGKKKSGKWIFECVNTSVFSTNLVTTGSGRNP
jgi:hypothetical protein